MQQNRIFDWRFIVSVTVLLLVVTLCWSVTKRINQGDDLVAIAATSARRVDQLTIQNRQLQTQQAATVRTQRFLLSEIKAVQAQNAVMVRILRRNGLTVPRVVSAPSGGTSGVTHPPTKHGKSPGPKPGHPKPTTRPTHSPSPLLQPQPLCDMLHLVPCPLG